MVAPTHVRFPEPVDKGLADYARRVGVRKSTVVVGALREWLRMEAHQGIVFVTTVTGERRAALAVGPQVWVVAEAWQQHDAGERTSVTVADTLGLAVHDVETALGYWADHRDEIDGQIARHQAEQDEALAAWERSTSAGGGPRSGQTSTSCSAPSRLSASPVSARVTKQRATRAPYRRRSHQRRCTFS